MTSEDPTIEQSFPVSESTHFDTPVHEETRVTVLVRVIATPDYYGVWVQFSPTGTTEFTTNKYFKPSEARSVSSQILDNDAPRLIEKLGSDMAVSFAQQLDFSADLAASLSYGDVVGMEEIKQYKRGHIEPEELVNDFGLKLLEEIDSV